MRKDIPVEGGTRGLPSRCARTVDLVGGWLWLAPEMSVRGSVRQLCEGSFTCPPKLERERAGGLSLINRLLIASKS